MKDFMKKERKEGLYAEWALRKDEKMQKNDVVGRYGSSSQGTWSIGAVRDRDLASNLNVGTPVVSAQPPQAETHQRRSVVRVLGLAGRTSRASAAAPTCLPCAWHGRLRRRLSRQRIRRLWTMGCLTTAAVMPRRTFRCPSGRGGGSPRRGTSLRGAWPAPT